MMALLQTAYPFVLAGTNVAGGWLLYDLFESLFGGFLVVVGLLVVLAFAGDVVRNDTHQTEKST
jgi:hypothetical protein